MVNHWAHRYLRLAHEVGQWSKDPSTKVGAIAIGDKGQVLSQGYNGFPRGIIDDERRYNNRETKYKYIVHAEQNVIYNATYNGVSLDGATLFVTGLPVCSHCALGLIQVGIKKVYMPEQNIKTQWIESWELTKSLFQEAGVEWHWVK
jgi:dCMP deaminase